MKKAYNKDILRSILRSKKRFLSILAITALGVTVLTGIYAACQDMYYSADQFYDGQNLFDIRIFSTLGLTDEDIEALGELEEIELLEGSYSENVDTYINGIKYTAQVAMLSRIGMNVPYVAEGRLPSVPGEVAVTQKYLDDAGKNLGDTLEIVEEQEEKKEGIEEGERQPNFLNTVYTITAVVADPMDISNSEAAFRYVSSATDYTFFITPDDVASDIYTCIYLTIHGLREWDCYSSQYEGAVGTAVSQIESEIKKQREEARYDSIVEEARGKIKDAEATMNEKFAEAEGKLAEARRELEEGRQELSDGETELLLEEKEAHRKIAEARAELADGRKELVSAGAELEKGERELQEAKSELLRNEQELAEGKEELRQESEKAAMEFSAAEAEMEKKQADLDQSRKSLETGISRLQVVFGTKWPEAEWNALAAAAAGKTVGLLAANPDKQPDPTVIAAATGKEQESLATAIYIQNTADSDDETDYTVFTQDCIQAAIGMGILDGSQQVFNSGRETYQIQKEAALQQITAAEGEISEGERQIREGFKKLEESGQELENGKQEIAAAWEELEEGEAKLEREEAKADKEIENARKELENGKQELLNGERELLENEEKYQEERKEAEEKIADAYKGLGDIAMAEWYVQDRNGLDSYSSLKSDMSSIESIGTAFPILFLIVAILISLTTMTRMVEEERGLIGTYKALGYRNGTIYKKYLLYAFLACILGAAFGDFFGFIILPKFLMSVLQKLYIFPYISLRFDLLYGIGGGLLFMAGIVGSALFVCRSELRQMPSVLMRPKAPRSGSRVFLDRIPFIWNRLEFLDKVTMRNLFRYKKRLFMTVFGIMGCTALVLAGFAIKDSVTDLMPKQYDRTYQYDLMAVAGTDDYEGLQEIIANDGMVTGYIGLGISGIKIKNASGISEHIQLMVVPDAESLEGYISLLDMGGKPVQLDGDGIVVTVNAAGLLGLDVGDTAVLETLELDQGEVAVSSVVQNYLGNNVYMVKEVYESLFGKYTPNSVLAHLSEDCEDPAGYAKGLLKHGKLLSSVSIEGVKEDFSSNFALINTVVYMITILAAGLAFVVLFTLSNTNISERTRELATTKVLGFYDREVYAYVNKETLILTMLGILAGLPVGRILSGMLTSALKMPSIYFAVYVAPISYVYTAVISFCFALMVNLITNRTLNRINMVEALKSVE